MRELKENINTLKYSADVKNKAIALSWILHLCGDLHQPLHCVSEYSTTFPEGDRGGNSQFVCAPKPGAGC